MEVEREIESEIIIGRLLGSEGYGKGYLGDGVQEEGKYFCDCCMSERNGVSEELCLRRAVSQKSCVSEELCPIMGCVSKRCLRRAVSQKSCVP